MKDFIEISKYAGMREDLVQAGGGNSAYKLSPARMVIKASGYQLADLTETSGYAVVNPQVIKEAFFQCENLQELTEEDAKKMIQESFIEGEKPSIEVFLHAVSGKYSLHTHPIVVNILTSRIGGMDALQKLFPDAWMIPYATPGAALAKLYFEYYKKHSGKLSVAFLQNHGLLVSADTAQEVIAKTEQVVKKIEDELAVNMSAYHAVTELYHMIGKGIIWRVTDSNVLNARSKLGRIWNPACCPDCVVFLGKRMYDAGNTLCKEDFEQFLAEYGEPVVIAYQNELYIQAASVKKALEIQSVLSFSAQVMLGNIGYECQFLTKEEQDFLCGWDAEKYRRNLK